MKTIRVLVADDHSLLRMGLVTLLGTEEGVEVVGEAQDGEESVRKAEKLHPDVVIMDLMMPVLDGVEALKRIKDRCAEIKVLVLTSAGSSSILQRALEAGADGVVLKSAVNAELIKAVKSIAHGDRVVADDVAALLATDPPVEGLTSRQQDVLVSLVRGLSNKDIALELGIAPSVVREHLYAIFRKLGAANRQEAVAIALRKQLVKA